MSGTKNCMILPALPWYDVRDAEPLSFGVETEEDINYVFAIFWLGSNCLLSDSVAAKSGFPLSTHVLHLFNKLWLPHLTIQLQTQSVNLCLNILNRWNNISPQWSFRDLKTATSRGWSKSVVWGGNLMIVTFCWQATIPYRTTHVKGPLHILEALTLIHQHPLSSAVCWK